MPSAVSATLICSLNAAFEISCVLQLRLIEFVRGSVLIDSSEDG